MLVPGLLSVTFRDRTVEEIAGLAAACGLSAVEWSGDVHVRPGDASAAERAAKAAADNGLSMTGYGSYHWAGDDPVDAFAPVLDSAAALGVPTVRVWAGRKGSADASPVQRAAVEEGLAAIVADAAALGISVALEFHAGTLTDTAAGARALCEATGARSHWQPPVGLPDDEALAGLEEVAHLVVAADVFAWGPRGERHPLSTRSNLWRAALRRLAAEPGVHPALLEFVRDDDPENLRGDAAALLDLLTVPTEER